MTDFQNNIVFVKGQIIDIETSLTKDSISQTKYQYIIPKYDLNFELRDSSLGIIRYNFHLDLDQYGQVIKFDWPRREYNNRNEFLNADSVLKFAVEYAKSKGYKTEIRKFGLKYYIQYRKLCWLISFLQSEGEFKKYKTIVIDLKRLIVIEETDMFEGGRSVN